MALLRFPGGGRMKTIFAGPSIFGLDFDRTGLDLRGPAEAGDVERAVADGANVIGLIDGHYQQVGAVWHKELLYALSLGVTVLGAASMGALRAAECWSFGMQAVGTIAERYCRGNLVDDSAVAITNAPAEMGYMPLSEAAVDMEATIEAALTRGLIDNLEHQRLAEANRRMFFQDRTIDTLVRWVELGPRGAAIRTALEASRISVKSRDALELIERVRDLPDIRSAPPTGWRLSQSAFWRDRAL
jgi:hypothetical protein